MEENPSSARTCAVVVLEVPSFLGRLNIDGKVLTTTEDGEIDSRLRPDGR